MPPSDHDFTALLELAESVALAAGELLANRPATFALSEKTSAVDFATQMDIASEKLIVDSVLALRPTDGIIGEEGAARDSTSGITWVIDPLDGTVNYFYGLPGWNVSIAAKDADGVCVGVVYSPTTNSLWTATRGGGARYNGEVIRCNDPVAIEMALLGTGFAYDRERRKYQADVVARLIPNCRDIRRAGAAAVDLCYVAMGALDGYFEFGLKEWDLAAGGLIAAEAGAVVTGDIHAGQTVVAAGPALHPSLAALVS
jgi:myo-inositol-1(or 4)-monophosphatase